MDEKLWTYPIKVCRHNDFLVVFSTQDKGVMHWYYTVQSTVTLPWTYHKSSIIRYVKKHLKLHKLQFVLDKLICFDANVY